MQSSALAEEQKLQILNINAQPITHLNLDFGNVLSEQRIITSATEMVKISTNYSLNGIIRGGKGQCKIGNHLLDNSQIIVLLNGLKSIPILMAKNNIEVKLQLENPRGYIGQISCENLELYMESN